MAADYIGKEIEIHTDKGKFYGIIHSVDVQNQKIVLQKGETYFTVKNRISTLFIPVLIYYYSKSILKLITLLKLKGYIVYVRTKMIGNMKYLCRRQKSLLFVLLLLVLNSGFMN